MDTNAQKTSSQALLSCGNGRGLNEKLLLKPKAGSSLQTQRLPRSSVLERLHSFLPQMAEANEKLRQQMQEAPDGYFDIERVEEAQKVIEMDVALVELGQSDSDSDEGDERDSDSEDDSDSDGASEITEQTLKLPGHGEEKKKKINIEVVSQRGEQDN
ncbi:NOP protein chaperone 1 [Nelusetta ayraudi]|uniref:NOP protein chaperone 1 n=1 Tax=Nelusetta ayraudi TaxID=303726 RepID=UPI003F70577B